MNTENLKRFRWFWAWQDEKEEQWLADMAQHGLHLVTVSPFGIYHFRQGEPGNYIYRLDFQAMKAKDRESYLQLFQDAGWEHVGDMGGWVYFRHVLDGTEIPEIFSDLESKIGKYQRLMTFLVIFLPIMVVLMPRGALVDRYGSMFVIFEILKTALVVLFAYAFLRVGLRINQLKKKQ
jgi:hypothetical protein